MRLALDTNRYSDFVRGDSEVVARVQEATSIVLPLIVLSELRAGFLGGTRARANESILSKILQERRVSVACPDLGTTHHYAAIASQLRRQGTPIPTNDVWIAALVVQHDLVLYSRDPHFRHIPQIARV